MGRSCKCRRYITLPLSNSITETRDCRNVMPGKDGPAKQEAAVFLHRLQNDKICSNGGKLDSVEAFNDCCCTRLENMYEFPYA